MASHSEKWRKAVCESNSKRVPELWKDEAWREKELARRKAVNDQPEVKENRSAATKALWDDPEWRAKVMRTRRRTMYSNPEWIEKASKAGAKATKKKFHGHNWNAGHTKDTHPGLMKISKSLAGRIPDYFGYTCWYKGINGRIKMKSSWERAFAQWLDANGILWRYEPRWFNIGKGEWIGVSYTPDFYLPDHKLYIELKGNFDVVCQAKTAAFRSQYPKTDWVLLLKDNLFALGFTIVKKRDEFGKMHEKMLPPKKVA